MVEKLKTQVADLSLFLEEERLNHRETRRRVSMSEICLSRQAIVVEEGTPSDKAGQDRLELSIKILTSLISARSILC